MVKEFLSQKGLTFEERDVSLNPSYAQELVRNTKQMGVPVTIINGQTVIGFDRRQLEQLLTQNQTSQRPSFGASIADAHSITAKQALGITYGAYIGRVRTGSVADRIGLVPGDVIIELNMNHIDNASDFENALSKLTKGSRISLVFLRMNKRMIGKGTL